MHGERHTLWKVFAAALILWLLLYHYWLYATRAAVDESFRAEVVRLVNVERAKEGLPPVIETANLLPAADLRASEAAGKFSHTRPDKTSWKTVFDQMGITSDYKGENLAKGQKTPEAVMAAWMHSPGHRANILNPRFNAIEIGLAENSKGKLFWCQLFMEVLAPVETPPPPDPATLTGQRAWVQDGLNLNLRRDPASKKDIVTVMTGGSEVRILEENKGWALVRTLDGLEGWAKLEYLRK
jgi:uncharacterized protein YgiM (DUF1202 family)